MMTLDAGKMHQHPGTNIGALVLQDKSLEELAAFNMSPMVRAEMKDPYAGGHGGVGWKGVKGRTSCKSRSGGGSSISSRKSGSRWVGSKEAERKTRGGTGASVQKDLAMDSDEESMASSVVVHGGGKTVKLLNRMKEEAAAAVKEGESLCRGLWKHVDRADRNRLMWH